MPLTCFPLRVKPTGAFVAVKECYFMLKLRPILLVNGILLCLLALFMLVPAYIDLMHDSDDRFAFLRGVLVTLFVGGGLYFTSRGYKRALSLREAFVLTASVWCILPLFAALPFYFSELKLSYTDAYFEAISGITTTGATVLVGLDHLPTGILLWRALLQWIGGIGIIALAMTVLPLLQIGGMQLFRTESSDQSDKIFPRASQVAGMIGILYVFFTSVCALLLWLAGMNGFDAICHAMTTIATAGYSTHDESIGYFGSPLIEYIIAIFMVLSGIPFVLYFQFLRGRRAELWGNSQVRWFIGLILAAVAMMTFWLYYTDHYNLGNAFRYATFNVISVATTTGYASADYYHWGGFAVIFLFMLSVTGGCTGSTTGGIKIFRYQVFYEIAKAQISRLVHPHGIFMPQYNRKTISDQISSSVMSFFILFAFCFLVLAVALSLFGLDYITSMSASASMLANLGPGLGEVIGPTGNYSSLPDGAKWLLAVGMIAGRLELFTLLVLFSPHFWRD